jgi:NTE family protein
MCKKKSWGPNYFRFGLNAATTFDDKIEFTALLRHERLNIGDFSGEWINEFTIGGDYQYYTEYYQPLMINQRFFLKPYGKIGRYFKDGYEAHQLIGEYDLRRSQLGVDIGMNIDNVAQVLTGLRYQDLTARLRVGNSLDLHVGNTQQAGWHLRFDYDDLDHRVFAKEGSQLHFHAVAYDDAIAGDLDYHKLVFYGRHHWPINERRVLFSEITLGTFLKIRASFL